jgi:hypothetical protein
MMSERILVTQEFETNTANVSACRRSFDLHTHVLTAIAKDRYLETGDMQAVKKK